MKNLRHSQLLQEEDTLLVPLWAHEIGDRPLAAVEAAGVIRCSNKIVSDGDSYKRHFTDDDAAFLSAFSQALAPVTSMIVANRKAAFGDSVLKHQLHTHLSYAINKLEEVEDKVWKLSGQKEKRTISTDFLLAERKDPDARVVQSLLSEVDELRKYIDTVVRVVDGADKVLSEKEGAIPIHREVWQFYRQILSPAIKLTFASLRERDFDVRSIRVSRFAADRKVFVDGHQLQVALYNILENAIKYAYDDPERFEILIDMTLEASMFVVTISDWGIGVRKGTELSIFDEQKRGQPDSSGQTGQGIGLWNARRVIEAHHGKILLKKRARPTQFTITLPDLLQQ